MTHRVGNLCHVSGRIDTCRITSIESVPAGSHDGLVDMLTIETQDGLLTVESRDIVRSWPAKDGCAGYEPPASRCGSITAIEVHGDDARPWDVKVGNTMP